MSEVGAARRHGQLLIKKAVTYFPATTAKLKLPSKLGTHLWKLHCGNLKPDEKFLKLLEEVSVYLTYYLNYSNRCF